MNPGFETALLLQTTQESAVRCSFQRVERFLVVCDFVFFCENSTSHAVQCDRVRGLEVAARRRRDADLDFELI